MPDSWQVALIWLWPLAPIAVIWRVMRWRLRRDQRCWEVQQLLRALAQRIREEAMSEEWREGHRQWQQQ
jgi:hypothetical protein